MTGLAKKRRLSLVKNRYLIENGSCGANAFWKLYSDGTLEISGTGQIESAPWTGDYDFSNGIVRLIISDGITSIPEDCLIEAENLVSAILPDSITVINVNGFRECRNLILEHLPAGLNRLEYAAFYGCNSIAITKMPVGLVYVGDYQFRECFGLQKIYFYSTPVIGRYAFVRCDNLTDIYVPWAEGEVAWAPWGADISTSGAKHINIHYNTVYDENGEPITEV